MIDPATASLAIGGTAGFGGVVGAIAGFMKAKSDAAERIAERQAQRDLENRISERNQLTSYAAVLQKASAGQAPVVLKSHYTKTRPKWWIFGDIIRIEKELIRETLPTTRRSITIARLLWMLTFAYAVALLACALDPSAVLWTIPGTDDPQPNEFFWGLAKVYAHSREVVAVTAGHFILPLALPIVFIVSAYATGVPFRKGL